MPPGKIVVWSHKFHEAHDFRPPLCRAKENPRIREDGGVSANQAGLDSYSREGSRFRLQSHVMLLADGRPPFLHLLIGGALRPSAVLIRF